MTFYPVRILEVELSEPLPVIEGHQTASPGELAAALWPEAPVRSAGLRAERQLAGYSSGLTASDPRSRYVQARLAEGSL